MTGRALTVEAAESARARFEAKVDRSGPGECWTWTGARLRKGYGRIRVGGRVESAHRIAWVLANGALIPEGMVIRHTCDVPPCCRPSHLALGTDVDNTRDMIERGRARTFTRRSVCKYGHSLDAPGARKKPCGRHSVGECRSCAYARARASMRAYRARKRARERAA